MGFKWATPPLPPPTTRDVTYVFNKLRRQQYNFSELKDLIQTYNHGILSVRATFCAGIYPRGSFSVLTARPEGSICFSFCGKCSAFYCIFSYPC